jgi:undecaprenyl-diphosphatase
MFNSIDHWLFLKINHGASSSFLDRWMPIITDFHQTPIFLALLLPLFIGYIIHRERERGVFFLLGLVVAVGLSDFVTYRAIKVFVKRDRPEMTDLRPIVRVPSHSGHSFPSNHAANVTALATFTGFIFYRLGAMLSVFAVLVMLSRIYVGVHFPSDVLVGGIVGALIATVSWKLFEFIEDVFDQRTLEREEAAAHTRREGKGALVSNAELKRVWANSKGVVSGEVKASDFEGGPRKKKRESSIILEAIDRAAPEEIAIGDLGDLEETEKIKK